MEEKEMRYYMVPNIGVRIILGWTVAKFGRDRGYYTIIGKHSLREHLIRTGMY
jgi:hypothetical protein